jgi:branched-chain amino acid aminotransferase
VIPPEVPADDRGLLLGDGLFETILAIDGVPQAWDAHLARLERGCEVIGIEPPHPAAAKTLAERAMAQAGQASGRAAVRLTFTAGEGRGLERQIPPSGRLIARASPAPRPGGPAGLETVAIRRNPTSPLSRIKSLSYLDNVLARRQARDAGADEALMLNTKGELACAAAANLFWVRSGRLYTPALECGVLDGIMRGLVIEAARAMSVEVVELAAPLDALEAAEAVFLTNSLIGVRPVGRLDGRTLPSSPLVQELSSRCS